MTGTKDVYLNLQINYFVISKSWDFVNMRKKDKEKEKFYGSLGLPRNAVSCLINDPASAPNLINIWNRSSEKMQSLGLSKEIMLGKEAISVGNISREEWKSHFDFVCTNKVIDRDAEKKFRTEKAKRKNEMVKRLREVLKELHPNRHATDALGILFYYLCTGQRIDTDQTDYQIKELQFALNNIRCDHWKDYDDVLLTETIKAMTLQLKNATTVYEYRKLQ